MHTIWKFPIPQADSFTLNLPQRARFLDVQIQNGVPQAWFLLDPNAEKEARRFVLAGTGHPVPEQEKLKHLGTFQMLYGTLVVHLFEYEAP